MIKLVESIKLIEHRYNTGEEPVLVQCSDLTARICKYTRSSGSAYKLACELIGNFMAKAWNIGAPDFCFVKILRQHIPNDLSPHFFSQPCFGTTLLSGVIDITPSTYRCVYANNETLLQLLKIALFDFWIANEDRNANNANLMYDVINCRIVPIDFGCILNTATFDYRLMQLTSTDTILYADLFRHITKDIEECTVISHIDSLKQYYQKSITESKDQIPALLDAFPKQWHISTENVNETLQQLFTESWIEETWDNFTTEFKDNLK